MLPRAALTSGTLQPSLALQAGVPVDAARPQPWTAALANLRAEMLLRLIETMLRHMPRGHEALAGRDLLEALFSALKPLAARDGENGRRLSELISRLPAELRPAAEKLIATALTLVPTRDLAAVLRNPDGAAAQRLATLLAASLVAGSEAEALPAGTDRPQQRIAGLTMQQLAAVSRHGTPAEGQPAEARNQQAALKRFFEPDGGRPQQPSFDRAANLGGTAPSPARAELQNPAAEDLAPTQADEAGEEPAAPNVMQAVVRKAAPDLLMQALVRLVAGLAEEEVQIIRTLLQRPFEDVAEAEGETATPAHDFPEDGAEAATAKTIVDGDGEPAPAGQARRDGEAVPAAGARGPATAEETRTDAKAPAEAARAAMPAETAATPALPTREGVPLAFVPYLAAEDELDWHEAEKSDDEETAEDGQDGEREGDEADGAEEAGPDAEEPESPDMAQRRRKTADLVVAPQTGFTFNDRPGHYWA